MKVSSDFTKTDVLKTGGKTVDMTVSDNSGGMLFVILSEGLYADSVSSLVRELTTNAIDAHIEKGNTNVPVTVGIGKDESGQHYFFVQDRGIGMSRDTLENVYSKYMASTKRESNEQHGYFGLGSKSPLAYTDVFYIVTVHDGIENVCAMSKGETSTQFSFIRERRTGNPNGTRIWFYIKPHDYSRFELAMERQLGFFDNVIFEGVGLPNDFKIWKNGPLCHTTLHSKSGIVLGNVWYPDNKNMLPSQFTEHGMSLYCPIGSVMVTPSREDIRYTDSTMDYIQNRIKEAERLYAKELSKSIINLDAPAYQHNLNPIANNDRLVVSSIPVFDGKFTHKLVGDDLRKGILLAYTETDFESIGIYNTIAYSVNQAIYLASAVITEHSITTGEDVSERWPIPSPTNGLAYTNYGHTVDGKGRIPDKLLADLIKKVYKEITAQRQNRLNSLDAPTADQPLQGIKLTPALVLSQHVFAVTVGDLVRRIFAYTFSESMASSTVDALCGKLSTIFGPTWMHDIAAEYSNKFSDLMDPSGYYSGTDYVPKIKSSTGVVRVRTSSKYEYSDYKAFRNLDPVYDGKPQAYLANRLYYGNADGKISSIRGKKSNLAVNNAKLLLNIMSNIRKETSIRIAYVDAIAYDLDMKGGWPHSRIMKFFDAGNLINGKPLQAFLDVILVDRRLIPSVEYAVALKILEQLHPACIVDVTDEIKALVQEVKSAKLGSAKPAAKAKTSPSGTPGTSNTSVVRKTKSEQAKALTITGYRIIQGKRGTSAAGDKVQAMRFLDNTIRKGIHQTTYSPVIDREHGANTVPPGSVCVSANDFNNLNKEDNEHVRTFLYALDTEFSHDRGAFKRVSVVGSASAMKLVKKRVNPAYVTVHDYVFGNEIRRNNLLAAYYIAGYARAFYSNTREYVYNVKLVYNVQLAQTHAITSLVDQERLFSLALNVVAAELWKEMPHLSTFFGIDYGSKIYPTYESVVHSILFDPGVAALVLNEEVSRFTKDEWGSAVIMVPIWIEHFIPYPLSRPVRFDAYYKLCYDLGYDIFGYTLNAKETCNKDHAARAEYLLELVLRNTHGLSAATRKKLREIGFDHVSPPKVYSKYFFVEPTQCITG